MSQKFQKNHNTTTSATTRSTPNMYTMIAVKSRRGLKKLYNQFVTQKLHN